MTRTEAHAEFERKSLELADIALDDAGLSNVLRYALCEAIQKAVGEFVEEREGK